MLLNAFTIALTVMFFVTAHFCYEGSKENNLLSRELLAGSILALGAAVFCGSFSLFTLLHNFALFVIAHPGPF